MNFFSSQRTTRWLLFFAFFLSIPCPWLLFIAAGIGPVLYLLLLSIERWQFLIFLAPQLVIYVLFFYFLSGWLAKILFLRLKDQSRKIVTGITLFCLANVPFLPIYCDAGHGRANWYSLPDLCNQINQSWDLDYRIRAIYNRIQLSPRLFYYDHVEPDPRILNPDDEARFALHSGLKGLKACNDKKPHSNLRGWAVINGLIVFKPWQSNVVQSWPNQEQNRIIQTPNNRWALYVQESTGTINVSYHNGFTGLRWQKEGTIWGGKIIISTNGQRICVSNQNEIDIFDADGKTILVLGPYEKMEYVTMTLNGTAGSAIIKDKKIGLSGHIYFNAINGKSIFKSFKTGPDAATICDDGTVRSYDLQWIKKSKNWTTYESVTLIKEEKI